MSRVYLDSNATTPVLPAVLDAMLPFYREQFGNASSIHQYGQHARAAVERARESVARLFGCRAAEVVFTSGGTEGDNLAIFGLAQPGDHIITSTIEHHAVLNACAKLEKRGCEVTYLPVDGRGLVSAEDVRGAIRPNTKLISIMYANNETGVIQPVEAVGAIAAEADVYFHTDAVQAASKVPLDVNAIHCDLLSISGHKMHGPQGIGAVYVRRGTLLEPLFYGGNHERQRRAGTENLPGIIGLGAAAEIALRDFGSGATAKVGALRDRLEQGVLALVQDAGVNGEGARRVPNTSNIWFDGVEGEPAVISLDLKGIAVSTGAACSSGAIEPSHVLTAMGLSAERARSSLRFSLGKHNSEADVDFVLATLPSVITRLREISPVYAHR
ncbi:MAG: cysteine desulfurase NifS [Acidobacteriaceae bacterium]